jgi:acyl dehydratase
MSSTPHYRRRRMVFWEDVVKAPLRRYGPVVFPSELLDKLLDLMGERHPVHDDDRFARLTARKRRIVPGGFIHSFTSGLTVQHGSPSAVVGLRSVTWNFVRPLYPDKPFFFSNQTLNGSEIDERLGQINAERRVFDENDAVYAIGRMNVVLLRRAAVPRQTTESTKDAEGLHEH